MKKYEINIISSRYQTLLLLCALLLLCSLACSTQQSKAFQMVEEQLKAQNKGISDVKLDLFHTSPKLKDKAYMSVTVTYGFASADGKPQREYLGYILIKKGNDWAISDGNNPKYTVSNDEAEQYITGEN